MAQFDIYQNLSPRSKNRIPYLLDIQHDLLSQLTTRVVIPLVLRETMSIPADILNPVFIIEGRNVVLSTAELAGIDKKQLGSVITNINQDRDKIIAAIDLLVTGI